MVTVFIVLMVLHVAFLTLIAKLESDYKQL